MKNVYYTHAPEGREDAILMHKDKNPNREGVRVLSPEAKPFADLAAAIAGGSVTHLLALGGQTPGGEADASTLTKLTALVAVAAHESAIVRAATVVFPATSWAEHSGTYINAKGLRQVADKAIDPQGSSQPAWKHWLGLANALGLDATAGKLKEIRAKLGVPDPAATILPTTSTQAV